MQRSAILQLNVNSAGAVTGFAQFNAAARATEAASASVRNTLLGMASAFAAFKAIASGKEVLALASRYETLGVVMKVVGGNAGYTNQQMREFQRGLEATGISMIESRNNLARMVQAHISLSRASELARIAQNAATIGNISSSEAFERMVMGIQRGEIIMLRTIGLNVNFEAAYKKKADALGVARGALTEEQKAEAKTQAVVEAGLLIQGAYTAAMETASKQMLSTIRYAEDMKVKVGTAFLPEYTKVVFGYAEALKWMGQNSTIVVGVLTGLVTAITAVAGALALAKVAAIAFAATPIGLAIAVTVGALAIAAGAAAKEFADARKQAAQFADQVADMPLNLVTANMQAMTTQIKMMKDQLAMADGMKERPVDIALGRRTGASFTMDPEKRKETEDRTALLQRELTMLQARKKEIEAGAPTALKGPEVVDQNAIAAAAALRNELEGKSIAIQRQKALNEAYLQTDTQLAIIRIRYDALAEKQRNSADYSGGELARMNALTDAMAEQDIIAVKLRETLAAKQAVDEANKRGTDQLDDMREANRQERELLAVGLRNIDMIDTMTVSYAGLNAERAVAAGTSPTIIAAIRAEAEEMARLAIARRKAEERVKVEDDATKDLVEQQKRAEEERFVITRQYAKRTQTVIADAIFQGIRDGGKGWDGFFDNILRSGARLVAEKAAQRVMESLPSSLTGTASAPAQQQIASTGMQSAAAVQLKAALIMAQAAGQQVTGSATNTATSAAKQASTLAEKIGAGIAVATTAYTIGRGLGGLTTNRLVGAGAGALGGAGAGAAIGTFIFPVLGTAVGAIVGGLAGLVGGLFGATAAQKQARAAAEAQTRGADGLRVTMGIMAMQNKGLYTGLVEQLANNVRAYSQLQDDINKVYAGKENRAERERLLAEAGRMAVDAANRIQEKETRRLANAGEDLEVRRLFATGANAEADALRLSLNQEREVLAAKEACYTETMIAQLMYVQSLEKLSQANDERASGVYQAPDGFDIANYRFEARGTGRQQAPITLSGNNIVIEVPRGTTTEMAESIVRELQQVADRQGVDRWSEVNIQ